MNNLLFIPVLCLVYVCVFQVDAIHWIDCGSKNVKSVTVTGCDKATVCPLPKGSNVSFAVDFDASGDASSAQVEVHGIIAGVPVPFPLDDPDACSGKGLTCPLKKGTHYLYNQALPVKSEYPKVNLVVEWELKDQNGGDIFCVKIPVKVVDHKTLYFTGGKGGNGKTENGVKL